MARPARNHRLAHSSRRTGPLGARRRSYLQGARRQRVPSRTVAPREMRRRRRSRGEGGPRHEDWRLLQDSCSPSRCVGATCRRCGRRGRCRRARRRRVRRRPAAAGERRSAVSLRRRHDNRKQFLFLKIDDCSKTPARPAGVLGPHADEAVVAAGAVAPREMCRRRRSRGEGGPRHED